MSLADELDKLAGEAKGEEGLDRVVTLASLGDKVRIHLDTILSALREREAVVAWLRSGGFTRDFGIPWRENLADAIEAGEHMKGEG